MSKVQTERKFILNPSLNIVMNSKEFKDYLPNKLLTFENESWMFAFEFDGNVTEEQIISSLNQYFESFLNLNFQSRIYASIISPESSLKVFEVYRKMSRGNPAKETLSKKDFISSNSLTMLFLRLFRSAIILGFRTNLD